MNNPSESMLKFFDGRVRRVRSNKYNWLSSSVAVSVDSRQQRRAVARKETFARISAHFSAESRKTRRILAFDSLRTHKKGV